MFSDGCLTLTIVESYDVFFLKIHVFFLAEGPKVDEELREFITGIPGSSGDKVVAPKDLQ